MSNEVAKQNESMLATQSTAPMGFEDEAEGDMIIPRVKVIQTLSPEKKDKSAEEGDIINSLTKDKLNGKVFVPVFKYNSNIWWKPRNEGGGILCHAREGKTGSMSDGTILLCTACKKNEFDNNKQGKEAIPVCTKYINFFGFITGERIPMILSFSKTNYNEGKKLYSLAKVTMENMWHYGYTINEKIVAKNGNEWYNIVVSAAGAMSEEDRTFGTQLYKSFRHANLNVDMEESETTTFATTDEVNSTEY